MDPTTPTTTRAAAAAVADPPVAPADDKSKRRHPPKENLVRGVMPFELRDAADGDGEGGSATSAPTLSGHFAVFNSWTEIDSIWEGNFMESIAPGAFAKTFKENRTSMRCLFQHGYDPVAGDKPLGPIDVLEEDDIGARYEVPLLTEASYVRDLVPGLRLGLYGASFRFRVMKEDVDYDPKVSATNPQAIPERVIREAQVMEFGPVTFPAYDDATAGVRSALRSLTDEFIFAAFARDPERVRSVIEHFGQPDALVSHPTASALAAGSRDPALPPTTSRTSTPSRTQPANHMSRDDFIARLARRR